VPLIVKPPLLSINSSVPPSVIVCVPAKTVASNSITSSPACAFAAAIASPKEQSPSHAPSSEFAVFVTVKVAAYAACPPNAARSMPTPSIAKIIVNCFEIFRKLF
jgi:hypothetical protein